MENLGAWESTQSEVLHPAEKVEIFGFSHGWAELTILCTQKSFINEKVI